MSHLRDLEEAQSRGRRSVRFFLLPSDMDARPVVGSSNLIVRKDVTGRICEAAALVG